MSRRGKDYYSLMKIIISQVSFQNLEYFFVCYSSLQIREVNFRSEWFLSKLELSVKNIIGYLIDHMCSINHGCC